MGRKTGPASNRKRSGMASEDADRRKQGENTRGHSAGFPEGRGGQFREVSAGGEQGCFPRGAGGSIDATNRHRENGEIEGSCSNAICIVPMLGKSTLQRAAVKGAKRAEKTDPTGGRAHLWVSMKLVRSERLKNREID
jgi:hypothetical protein